MTIDISKAKVGDIVTGRFESKVKRVYFDGGVNYFVTENDWYISTNDSAFVDLKFTTPKPPLPTASGSVIFVHDIYYMLNTSGRWVSNVTSTDFAPSIVEMNPYVIKYDAGADND